MVADSSASFRVEFEGLSAAEANRAAAELRTAVERAAGAQVQAEIVKERTDTQDFGATLVLVLGTPAVIVVARAIHNYVAKRGDRVVVRTNDGEVIATGAAAANIDIDRTVAAMRSKLDD